MRPRLVRHAPDPLHASAQDRRHAVRLTPHDVPWLVSVKPTIGDAARLVNISQTGVLLDTRDRLLPGRRTMLLASAADQRVLRVGGIVIRTHIVAIGEGSAPIYRTALMFEGPFGWELEIPAAAEALEDPAPIVIDPLDEPEIVVAQVPSVVPIAPPEIEEVELSLDELPEVPATGLRLDDPLDAVLTRGSNVQLVTIAHLTEGGCLVETSLSLSAGQWVSLGLLFSHGHRLTVNGRIADMTPNGYSVRFDDLTAAGRRELRVEIRNQIARARRARSLTGDSTTVTLVSARWLTSAGGEIGLQANQW